MSRLPHKPFEMSLLRSRGTSIQEDTYEFWFFDLRIYNVEACFL